MSKYSELITVVVPIYGVERYLKRCLDSIIHQSYSNLEIILVDDGSPDGCGDICDMYKEQDNRIQVIHQNNMGLSGARNTGLKCASGDYITFIDSDDFIEFSMIEKLYNNMQKTGTDISICGFHQIPESMIDNVQKQSGTFEVRVLTKKECQEQLLYHKSGIDIVTWNKLYKIGLFNNIRFPVGKIYEDFATIPFVINAASKICVTDEKMYYYIQRDGSINASQKMNNKIFDLIRNVGIFEQFVLREFPDSIEIIMPGILFFKSIAVNEFIKHGIEEQQREFINECGKTARKYFGAILKNPYLYTEQKVKLILFGNQWMYKKALLIKNRKH